jgi:hypothetical protein
MIFRDTKCMTNTPDETPAFRPSDVFRLVDGREMCHGPFVGMTDIRGYLRKPTMRVFAFVERVNGITIIIGVVSVIEGRCSGQRGVSMIKSPFLPAPPDSSDSSSI